MLQLVAGLFKPLKEASLLAIMTTIVPVHGSLTRMFLSQSPQVYKFLPVWLLCRSKLTDHLQINLKKSPFKSLFKSKVSLFSLYVKGQSQIDLQRIYWNKPKYHSCLNFLSSVLNGMNYEVLEVMEENKGNLQ